MHDFDFRLWEFSRAFGKIYENTTLYTRVCSRFFDQVGHDTMYASSGNKLIFTKSCHCQTCQNYEQSRQKLGTILVNKVS